MVEKVRDITQINETLAAISADIFPEGATLAYVPIDDLREQDVNAQTMPQKMFDQLIENIKSADMVESVPLCVRQGDVIFILSGHHRVRAARAAGITDILILLYDQLTVSSAKAKQLSHNSIAGQSDPELVKRIWEQITDVGSQFEAFIDPRLFDKIPKAVAFRPVDVALMDRAKAVMIMFLPIQQSDFEATIEAIVPMGDTDKAYLADADIYDQWTAALQRVRGELEIASMPTAVAEMARLAMKQLDQMAEDDGEKESV